MKKILILCLLFCGLTAWADIPVDPENFDNLEGKVHRGDLGRSGVFNATGITNSPRQLWKFQTGAPVKSSPVVVNNIAYFGSYDGKVYAVNTADGDEVWSYQTGDKVSGSAAVVSNTVFIAGENGNLYSLDAANGTLNWIADVPAGQRIAGSPAVAYGTVFIGGGKSGGSEKLLMSAQKIYGFDVETGNQVWISSSSGPQGFAAPALSPDTLFAGIGGSSYGAFDLKTGSLLWSKNNGGQNRQFMSASFIDDNVYFPGTIRGSVSCHAPGNGAENWLNTTLPHNSEDPFQMRTGGLFGYEIFTDLAIAHGRIYTGCNDGKLHTFDQAAGTRGWTFQTGGKVQSSPSVAGNIVYFGSWDGNVYAVNATDGNEIWRYNAGERIISSPWPGDGVIYFGCDDGAVYGLEAGGPKAEIISASPVTGQIPHEVSFIGQATPGEGGGTITNYNWNFGDGTPLTNGPALTNIVHIFSLIGNFTTVFSAVEDTGAIAEDRVYIETVPEISVIGNLLSVIGVFIAMR